MKVKCHQISRTGVVREHNEDFIAFWEPEEFALRQSIGSIAILADGVGGEGHGEVASRMAAEIAQEVFEASVPNTPAANIVRRIFDEASVKSSKPAVKKAAWRPRCSFPFSAMT